MSRFIWIVFAVGIFVGAVLTLTALETGAPLPALRP
jgi:hypothetical protein